LEERGEEYIGYLLRLRYKANVYEVGEMGKYIDMYMLSRGAHGEIYEVGALSGRIRTLGGGVLTSVHNSVRASDFTSRNLIGSGARHS